MLIDKLGHTINTRAFLCIGLNFVENGKHGCIKNCRFCNFRLNPIYLCPTIDELAEFLTTYSKYAARKTVLFTGGGDPLYNFEKNKDIILALMDCCNSFGFEVVIQSGELDCIKKYYNTLFAKVNCYYFSTEVLSNQLRDLAVELSQAGKKVAVSKVLNTTNKLIDINYDEINAYLKFYDISGIKIIFHENYNCCFTPEENAYLTDYFMNLSSFKAKIRYNQHRLTLNKFIVLANNEVRFGQNFIFMPKEK